MKYHNYTWNTGHVMHHDTEVDLRPDIIPMVRGLIEAREGIVPGAGMVWYELVRSEDDRSACLTTWGTTAEHPPIWSTLFFIDRTSADDAMWTTREFNVPPHPDIPEHPAAPGLLTVIHPSIAMADVSPSAIEMLADFAKTIFSVWALDRIQ